MNNPSLAAPQFGDANLREQKGRSHVSAKNQVELSRSYLLKMARLVSASVVDQQIEAAELLNCRLCCRAYGEIVHQIAMKRVRMPSCLSDLEHDILGIRLGIPVSDGNLRAGIGEC